MNGVENGQRDCVSEGCIPPSDQRLGFGEEPNSFPLNDQQEFPIYNHVRKLQHRQNLCFRRHYVVRLR